MRSHILSTASLQKALGNSSPGTYKKKDSKRRSSRKSDSATVTKTDQPTSQWYTTTEICHSSIQQGTPAVASLISNLQSTHIFELRQEVKSLWTFNIALSLTILKQIQLGKLKFLINAIRMCFFVHSSHRNVLWDRKWKKKEGWVIVGPVNLSTT